MNSILYILISKSIATIWITIFRKSFVKTEFSGTSQHQLSYHDSDFIRGEKPLKSAITYFIFYWFNRYFIIIYISTLLFGTLFLNIPFR